MGTNWLRITKVSLEELWFAPVMAKIQLTNAPVGCGGEVCRRGPPLTSILSPRFHRRRPEGCRPYPTAIVGAVVSSEGGDPGDRPAPQTFFDWIFAIASANHSSSRATFVILSQLVHKNLWTWYSPASLYAWHRKWHKRQCEFAGETQVHRIKP